MLTMLAEKLMDFCQMIQINTDGLTVKLKASDEQRYYDVCSEWMNNTGLLLEYADYSKMIIRDVNNYIAVYTNGKTKKKGFFEFENLPFHKNKSELIIPKSIYHYFIYGTPVRDFIKNHTNIFDFCIGVRSKKDSKFVYYNKDGVEHNLSKTIRYYISNQGVVIKKKYNDGRVSFLNVHPLKGKTYYQTIFNQFVDKDNYNINYSYYIHEAQKIIYQLENAKHSLF